MTQTTKSIKTKTSVIGLYILLFLTLPFNLPAQSYDGLSHLEGYQTTIRFSILHQSKVVLKIYNLLGEEVQTLVDEELSPGIHNRLWNADKAASGVYIVNLAAGEYRQAQRKILLR